LITTLCFFVALQYPVELPPPVEGDQILDDYLLLTEQNTMVYTDLDAIYEYDIYGRYLDQIPRSGFIPGDIISSLFYIPGTCEAVHTLDDDGQDLFIVSVVDTSSGSNDFRTWVFDRSGRRGTVVDPFQSDPEHVFYWQVIPTADRIYLNAYDQSMPPDEAQSVLREAHLEEIGPGVFTFRHVGKAFLEWNPVFSGKGPADNPVEHYFPKRFLTGGVNGPIRTMGQLGGILKTFSPGSNKFMGSTILHLKNRHTASYHINDVAPGVVSREQFLRWTRSFSRTVGLFEMGDGYLVASQDPNVSHQQSARTLLTRAGIDDEDEPVNRSPMVLTLQWVSKEGMVVGRTHRYPGGRLIGGRDSVIRVIERDWDNQWVIRTLVESDFR